MDDQQSAQAIADLRGSVTRHLADADEALGAGQTATAAQCFDHAQTSLAAIHALLRLASIAK